MFFFQGGGIFVQSTCGKSNLTKYISTVLKPPPTIGSNSCSAPFDACWLTTADVHWSMAFSEGIPMGPLYTNFTCWSSDGLGRPVWGKYVREVRVVWGRYYEVKWSLSKHGLLTICHMIYSWENSGIRFLIHYTDYTVPVWAVWQCHHVNLFMHVFFCFPFEVPVRA